MGKVTRLVSKAPKTSPKRIDPVTMYSGTTSAIGPNWNGRIGKANVELYRHWALHSEWIRGAINIRRQQVSSAEWAIVPLDKKAPYSKRLQARLTEQFTNPNPANDSFRSFIEPVIEDLIVLDAGCIEKERDLLGNLHYIWPVDGGTIRVNGTWDGDPEEPRYYWYPDYKLRASFTNDDFIYMMANRRTDSPVGFSPLESLKLTIQAELYGHEYNSRQVQGAAPDGVMDLGEGATNEDIRRYRSFFESEVAGRGAIGFVGGTKGAKWIPFRPGGNREMQFLEWQIYLVRKIAVVMGITPQDLGVTFDINRSTAETQIQISEDRGLRPLMSLIQEYLTQEVVWDESNGGRANNLAFRFTALNLKETTAKANINHLALAGVPYKTINEARIEDGREPLKGDQYDTLVMATSVGAVSLAEVPTASEVVDSKKPEPAAPPQAGKSDEPNISVSVTTPDVNVNTPDVKVNLPEKMVHVDARTFMGTPIISRTFERNDAGQLEAIIEVRETPEGRTTIRRAVKRDDHGSIAEIA